jgi:RNA ligase
MKIDLNEIKKREKYITTQKHNSADLLIHNYNNPCQFDGAWDEITTQTRGLITDSEGNIIARPFKKFFNLGQTPETDLGKLMELGEPLIYEKLDGSLGIQYWIDGVPQIATRGSFNSEQALWATSWLSWQELEFNPQYTYLYEIIYPTNRIVVNYGDRAELVLIAVINTETGNEQDHITEAKRLGLSYAKPFEGNFTKLQEYIKTLPPEEEGFVLFYPQIGLRVKIKGEEYVRLHRLITGFSNKSIWELLANGQSFDELLERVPDEFFEWVKRVKMDLENSFDYFHEITAQAFEDVKSLPTRKEQAEKILKEHKDIPQLIFGLLDKKDISPMIWKMIKPKFAKPYKIDIDL